MGATKTGRTSARTVSRSVYAPLALLVAAVALGGCATAGPAHRNPTDAPPASRVAQRVTVDRTVAPFTAGGTPAVKVLRTVTGSCFTTTVAAAPSPIGYRCVSTGNVLLDPCVAPAGSTHPAELACLTDPWSGATMLRLTGALPAPDPATPGTRPWAMVLAGGVRCVAVSGTVSNSHGVEVIYTCSDGGGAGTPTKASSGVWRAPHVMKAGVVDTAADVTQIWRI